MCERFKSLGQLDQQMLTLPKRRLNAAQHQVQHFNVKVSLSGSLLQSVKLFKTYWVAVDVQRQIHT